MANMHAESLRISKEHPFGIIGAMDLEIELLQEAMDDATCVMIGRTEYTQGTIDDVPCVVVQCGVGMVNAAACTQTLIDQFSVGCVMNTGVAGSLSSSINVGDLVAATSAVNWIMDVQNLGYTAGQTPGLPSAYLPTSDTLRSRALAAAEAEHAIIHEGCIASGDRFVRDASEKEYIAHTFDAICCEMEGAAIAQVCQANSTPCVLLRAISDTADGSDAIDYPTFEAAAAKHCAAITRRMVSLV